MNALFVLIPALLMILAVVGVGAWSAYRQVHLPSQRWQTQQVSESVTATRFVAVMIILMVLAILIPLIGLIIAFTTSPYAL